jgi:hypothetical protein
MAKADEISRTAKQVRQDRDVHKLTGNTYTPGTGHVYATRCRRQLRVADGAVLTTRPVSCRDCAHDRRALVDELLAEAGVR